MMQTLESDSSASSETDGGENDSRECLGLFKKSRTPTRPRVNWREGRWFLDLHLLIDELFSSVREFYHSVWNAEKHNFGPVFSSEVIIVHHPKRLPHNIVHCI